VIVAKFTHDKPSPTEAICPKPNNNLINLA
jgi:hypothetical protein